MPDKNILNTSESIVIGGLTGAMEVTINLPLWTIKMRSQCGLLFTLNPAVLYRGYPIALASMSSITALQLWNSSLLERSSLRNRTTVSSYERMTSSFMGGAIAACIFGPINLIGTQQHKYNYSSYHQAAKYTFNKIGIRGLFIGTPMTGLTDGIFTCTFFGMFPCAKNYIYSTNSSETTASLLTGAFTGIIAAIITQPVDVIKTIQQKEADQIKKSAFTCAVDLYKQGNKFVFFRGFIPRTIWLTSAVTTAGILAEKIENVVLNRRLLK